MYKCASCGFNSEEAGEHCGAPMAKAEQYKCATCGAESDAPGEHCNVPMDKMCACGSGNFSKDCCEMK